MLRTALFPTVNSEYRTPLPPNLLASKKDLSHRTRGVTDNETQLAISHLKYGTSVGPDNITYSTLRRFNEAAPHLLPHLFTACLRFAAHPPEWKTANCVGIPKPGKKSYWHPKSYRPISLQSFFGKLLESIVVKRLAQTAQMCGATHPSQMGAQPENSAIDALLRMMTPIANSISKKKTTNQNPARPAVLTLDIEGAFNQVHPLTLTEVMRQRWMPSYLIEWVAAFNTDRKIAFGFDQQTEEPPPYRCGLPQGSPISPILFLIYSNAMLEKQHYPGDAIDTSYMDDVCMVQMSHIVSRANTHLEDRTERHLENGVQLGLSFAVSKTELLYCLPLTSKDKNKSLSSHPPLRILNTTIPAKRQIQYLGVFIDELLTFTHHAAMAAARGNKILGSLSFLRHRSRGIPAYIAHHLAMTAILPAMFWASPAWWVGTPVVTTTLKVAYNAVARWITGLPLNTRSLNLITLAHLPPMDVFLDYLSLRYAIRLHFLPAHHALGPPRGQPNTHTNLPGLHRLHSLSKHLILGKLEDRATTTTAPGVEKATSPNPDKTTQPRELHEKWLQTLPDHTIAIYTDGSRLANGAVGCGWALYHCGDHQLYRLSDGRCHLGVRAEVYDVELHAVQEAVSTLLTTTMPPSKVFICIDNQAAIDTLHANKDNHEYARRSLKTIATLRLLGWQITTIWCPAHCNISGNERADKLAKLGASSATTPCRFARTTKTWLLSQARAEFLKRWKQTLPLSTPSFKFPSHLHGKDWADTRALWRVFCNPSPTDSPPNIEADPCPCGLDLNLSHHLLRDCPLLASQRTELVRSATGDIQTPGFITAPENFLPLRRFLRATGLGHTTHLCFEEAADFTATHADIPTLTHLSQTSARLNLEDDATEMGEKGWANGGGPFPCSACVFPLHCSHVAHTCFLLCCKISVMRLLCLAGRRDGNPTGVVRRGGARIACSVKRNRSKLHIISLHRPTSLPVTGAATTKPHKNNEPTQRRVRRSRRDHAGRDGYRENNEPTQRRVRRPRRDHAGRDGYRGNNEWRVSTLEV